MRCLLCEAEMVLVSVVEDQTMMVPGFEHHTYMCSSCSEIERRLSSTNILQNATTLRPFTRLRRLRRLRRAKISTQRPRVSGAGC